jgi:hypothetical protein
MFDGVYVWKACLHDAADGLPLGKSRAQASTVTATQDANGHVNLNVQMNVHSGDLPAATAIRSDVNIGVNEAGTQAQVSGTTSVSPAFEMNIAPQGGPTTRSISILLLVVGLLWGLIVTGLFALAGGFFGNNPPHNPLLIGKAVLSVWWMFLGPLLLIVGAICTLRGVYPRPGAIAAVTGCLMLTGTMVYQIAQVLHAAADPLIAKSYGLNVLFAIAAVVALLADAGAVQLYRLSSRL